MKNTQKRKLSKKDIQKIKGSYYSIHMKPMPDGEIENLTEKKVERYLNYEERWWHLAWFAIKGAAALAAGLIIGIFIIFLLGTIMLIFFVGYEELFSN